MQHGFRLSQSAGTGLKVLHLGKYDGDVGGIERHVRALLGGMPPEIEVVNLVAKEGSATDEHRANGYRTVRVANYASLASVALAAFNAIGRAQTAPAP